MENLLLKTVKSAVKNWYLHLIVGIALILTGAWTFSRPIQSYFALSIIFSISFLISGITEIVFASSNRKIIENWGWTFALGILTTIVGVLLIANPAISAVTLPIYVGFMLLFHSIWAIASAIDMKSYGVTDWGTLLLIGTLGAIFSFFVIWRPEFGGMSIVIWTGLALFSTGVFNFYLAIKMRKMHKKWEEVSEATKSKLEEAKKMFLDEINGKLS